MAFGMNNLLFHLIRRLSRSVRESQLIVHVTSVTVLFDMIFKIYFGEDVIRWCDTYCTTESCTSVDRGGGLKTNKHRESRRFV